MAPDPTKSISCKELVELVTDYFEGALSPEEQTRFEKHIAFCPGCTYYLEQMRLTIDRLGELREESIPPEAERDLLAAFRSWNAARD